jgi:hypothetical protein
MMPWLNGSLARTWLSAGALLAALAAPPSLHRYFGQASSNERPARSAVPVGASLQTDQLNRYLRVIVVPAGTEFVEPRACGLPPRRHHRDASAAARRK